uniref:HlyD family secretion protein n=1 Tax=Megasphaera sp. TaxID=2023260 RepID=UPI0040295A67
MFIEKKKWAAGLLLALAVVCLASGCSLQKEAASDELWGRADAKEIDINSKVTGRVVQLRVKEGDTVKQGDIIAYIDQRDLLAQKAQAEANIKALQAQVRQSGVVTDLQDSTSKSQVDTASAGLDSAQSNLDLAEKDFNRYQELYAQGAISKSVFDAYKTKYEVAQSAYSQAQSSVSSAQAGLLQTDANLAATDAAQKKLEAAQARLQQIEVSLDETELTAPFAGVITAPDSEDGSLHSLGPPQVALQ